MNFEIKAKNFFNNNQNDLINIYNQEQEKQGEGVLFITFNKEKVDVYYLKYEEILENIKNLCQDKTKKYLYINEADSENKFLIKLEEKTTNN